MAWNSGEDEEPVRALVADAVLIACTWLLRYSKLFSCGPFVEVDNELVDVFHVHVPRGA